MGVGRYRNATTFDPHPNLPPARGKERFLASPKTVPSTVEGARVSTISEGDTNPLIVCSVLEMGTNGSFTAELLS